MITVRSVSPSDAATLLRMRHALWPEGAATEHHDEIDRFLAGSAQEPLAILLAEDPAGCALGFAELSIRPYAEGCRNRRVAYLEGWFVVPEARRRGVGRALLKAAKEWGAVAGLR
jgi:aminoglycoside 6'-N-acetyltransferase I